MARARTSAAALTARRRREPVASTKRTRAERAIAIGLAVTLAIDAYIHATTAALHDPVHGGVLTAGNFFRFETAVRVVVIVLLLIRPARWSFVTALVVASTALGVVVLYRYVNVGAIGPIPNLYEPSWQVPGKVASAFAEVIVIVLSAAGVALIGSTPRGTGPARSPSGARHGAPSPSSVAQ